jgi:phage-related protein
MTAHGKPLVWRGGYITSPPFSDQARRRAGFFLRLAQDGERIGMPHQKPMTSIAPHCFELRVPDRQTSWQIIYRDDVDAIVILAVFGKGSRTTPRHVVRACRERLRRYDSEGRG